MLNSIQECFKNKTKRQFKNALRVLYGRKKDRGGIIAKYNQYLSEQERIKKAMGSIFPTLSYFTTYFM